MKQLLANADIIVFILCLSLLVGAYFMVEAEKVVIVEPVGYYITDKPNNSSVALDSGSYWSYRYENFCVINGTNKRLYVNPYFKDKIIRKSSKLMSQELKR